MNFLILHVIFITKTVLQVDGLGVVLSLDEVIGDVVMDILMMLILWLSWRLFFFHASRLVMEPL
jgi:hypothetical protein